MAANLLPGRMYNKDFYLVTDGEPIRNYRDLEEFFSDMGIDIVDLAKTLCFYLDEADFRDGLDETCTGDDWELIADEYYNALGNMRNEMDACLDHLAKRFKGVKTLEEIGKIKKILADCDPR